jgi:6-phosphogluconolactonase (cycloisomerase 2 family)
LDAGILDNNKWSNSFPNLAVSPDGSNIYMVSYFSNSIIHWDRDSATGALSNQVVIADSSNLKGAGDLKVSPDGNHVYATAITADAIVWWNRDSSTGALSNQAELIDSTNLNGPYTLTISPDGKYVYVLNYALSPTKSYQLTMLKRNSATGVLSNPGNACSTSATYCTTSAWLDPGEISLIPFMNLMVTHFL